MKISISVMIILTTLFCVLPFVWFMVIGKNNTKTKEKQIKNMIKGENVSFDTTEQWNNNFIGIDFTKNILIFVTLNTQDSSILRIDLNTLKTCQINKVTRDYKKEKKMETELQTLDLELTFLTNNETIVLNFYKITDEFSEDFEMKRAEKWKVLMQQNKSKSSAKSIAA